MKIYNKRKFVSGSAGLLIALTGAAIMIMDGVRLKLLLLTPFIFLIALFDIQNSLSKSMAAQAHIEEQDERSQLVSSKSSALSFKILQSSLIFLTLLFIVLYAIFEATGLVWIILTLSFLVFVSMVTVVCSHLYYEKRL